MCFCGIVELVYMSPTCLCDKKLQPRVTRWYDIPADYSALIILQWVTCAMIIIFIAALSFVQY
jgi:hypothetical protein